MIQNFVKFYLYFSEIEANLPENITISSVADSLPEGY